MGRYATREVELDELLRARSFIDLHTVVKRALVAGIERYSIKDLEPFFGYSRDQDLREAATSRRIVENSIAERNADEALLPHFEVVEAYNGEDCESAERLRDWLEELRDRGYFQRTRVALARATFRQSFRRDQRTGSETRTPSR